MAAPIAPPGVEAEGLLLVDAQGVIIAANCAAHGHLGVQRGNPLDAVLPLSEWTAWREALDETRRGGAHQSLLPWPAQGALEATLTAAPGGLVMVQFRPQPRSALQVQRRHPLSQLLRATGTGQWHYDPARKTFHIDTAMADLFELSEGSIKASRLLGCLTESDRQALIEALVIEPDDPPFAVQTECVRRGGGSRFLSWRGVVAQGTHASKTVCGLTLETTLTVEAKRRIAALEARLSRVDRLGLAGQLATGAAHDLNNVLTSVLVNAELLREEPLTEEGQECVTQILGAGRHAGKLSAHLLAFGQKAPLKLAPLDLSAFTERAISMARRTIPETVSLRCKNTRRGSVWVSGDATRLQQVLYNLVLNGVQAITGPGSVTVSLDSSESHAGWTVTDTGQGIPPEVIAQVFDPFYTTKKGGTGLGLSSVKGIIAQHSGQLECRSTVGVGTTFVITLPRTAGGGDAITTSSSRVPKDATGAVVVVDDERLIRMLVSRVLKRIGYQVETFSDPLAAQRRLEYGIAPDLLLTDVVMPGLSGADLAKTLEEKHPNTPVLFMSGYPSHLLDAKGVLPDAPFIAKPFTRRQLSQAVARILAPAKDPQ